jgi:hypothetical protein
MAVLRETFSDFSEELSTDAHALRISLPQPIGWPILYLQINWRFIDRQKPVNVSLF